MHLFKDDTDVDLARVMSINGWKHLKQQCLAMTPRRFGKTMSVGMFVAAYLYAVENAEICIFLHRPSCFAKAFGVDKVAD